MKHLQIKTIHHQAIEFHLQDPLILSQETILREYILLNYILTKPITFNILSIIAFYYPLLLLSHLAQQEEKPNILPQMYQVLGFSNFACFTHLLQQILFIELLYLELLGTFLINSSKIFNVHSQ